MRFWIVALIFTVSAGSGIARTEAASPYAGQQTRTIKALSPPQVRAYLSGDGLGYAKTAELNHYPGPRHVLDLATQLHLTASQRERTETIFERMHETAVPLGREIVAKEQRLDAAFARASIDDTSLKTQTAAIAVLEGRLRGIHLSAHLAMRGVLTAKQIGAYDRLRGYGAGAMGKHLMNGMQM